MCTQVGVTLVPKALADDNYDGQEDLASEFGQMYYPHGFRKIGEKVYDAIRRWFQYFESKDAVEERRLLKQVGRQKGRGRRAVSGGAGWPHLYTKRELRHPDWGVRRRQGGRRV